MQRKGHGTGPRAASARSSDEVDHSALVHRLERIPEIAFEQEDGTPERVEATHWLGQPLIEGRAREVGASEMELDARALAECGTAIEVALHLREFPDGFVQEENCVVRFPPFGLDSGRSARDTSHDERASATAGLVPILADQTLGPFELPGDAERRDAWPGTAETRDDAAGA